MKSHRYFDNTGALVRFIFRRDRIRLAVWSLSLILTSVLVAMAYTDLVSTEEERLIMAETMRNPAVTAMFGPGYGLENYTRGAIMGHQMLLFTALAVAVMSILLVTRHTRREEEEGRAEMFRSLPVGPLSSLASTMVVAVAVNLVIALFTGIGLFALGIETMDLPGSLLYGAVLGTVGIVFAAFTAVFAQLATTNRGASGYAFAFLGIAYLVRAIGDVSNEALSWLSPLGWVLRAQVYVMNHWWPVYFTLAVSLVVTLLAFYLNAIRDLEAGFIPPKPGRRVASKRLLSPLGWVLRLQRTTLVSWLVGVVLLGASYGSIMGDMESYLESIDLMQQLLIEAEGYSVTEQFIPMLMLVLALSSLIPALMVVLKLRQEERRNRLEHLLSRAVSRTRLLWSFVLVALLTAASMLIFSTLGLWGAAAAVMEEAISLPLLLRAALANLPALWLMTGLAVFLVGYFPEHAGFIWAYYGFGFFTAYFGSILQLPTWVGKLSPFGHVSKLPVESMDFVAALAMLAMALLLLVAGFHGYRRRDTLSS